MKTPQDPDKNCTKEKSPKVSANSSDHTDGRKPYEWPTKYSTEAIKNIRGEAIYLIILLAISFFFIFATWKGWVYTWLSIDPDRVLTFKKYAYCLEAGMLGGVAFDIKYLYRTVARGLWHQDRRVWRFLSPFVATTVAFVIGAMADASLMSTGVSAGGSSCVSVGFLSGYFADSAVGKMSEIAKVLFGKSAATKSDDEK